MHIIKKLKADKAFMYMPFPLIPIGKTLILSPSFPRVHTVHATFIAHSVPTNEFTLLHRISTLYSLTASIML